LLQQTAEHSSQPWSSLLQQTSSGQTPHGACGPARVRSHQEHVNHVDRAAACVGDSVGLPISLYKTPPPHLHLPPTPAADSSFNPACCQPVSCALS
jgi:hypothetical protein